MSRESDEREEMRMRARMQSCDLEWLRWLLVAGFNLWREDEQRRHEAWLAEMAEEGAR